MSPAKRNIFMLILGKKISPLYDTLSTSSLFLVYRPLRRLSSIGRSPVNIGTGKATTPYLPTVAARSRLTPRFCDDENDPGFDGVMFGNGYIPGRVLHAAWYAIKKCRRSFSTLNCQLTNSELDSLLL